MARATSGAVPSASAATTTLRDGHTIGALLVSFPTEHRSFHVWGPIMITSAVRRRGGPAWSLVSAPLLNHPCAGWDRARTHDSIRGRHADRGSSSWQPRGQLAIYLTPGYEETFDRAWRGRCDSTSPFVVYCALIQVSDPVSLTDTSAKKTRSGLPPAVPRWPVEIKRGPACL